MKYGKKADNDANHADLSLQFHLFYLSGLEK